MDERIRKALNRQREDISRLARESVEQDETISGLEKRLLKIAEITGEALDYIKQKK